MSDENALRIYQKLDEMARDIAKNNERFARIEEKLDNNACRCVDRGEWMKTVEKEIDALNDKAASFGGAKGLLAIIISIATAVSAWVQK